MDYVPLLNAEYEMVRCENDSDLVNKLKRMDPKFGHVLIVKAEFDSPIRDIPVAPNVKRVSFIDSIIKNYNILQFDKWCPNVSELEFVRTKFGKNVYARFTEFMSVEVYPLVKSFIFHFPYDMEEFATFIEEMDQKFPALEHLKFILTASDNLETDQPMWDDDNVYFPHHFENLKKFEFVCFGEEGHRIFDYMDISNLQLEELSFSGMWLTRDNLCWIKNCPQLRKLKLAVAYLEESELVNLYGKESLEEIYLEDIAQIEWDPKEMMIFVQNLSKLKVLSIACKRNNKRITFDDEFQTEFGKLLQQRGDVVMEVKFGEGDSMRHLKMSKDGLHETVPLVESDDEEMEVADGEMYYEIYSSDECELYNCI